MSGNDAYEKAKKRVEEKIGFFIHFGVYAAVMVILYSINRVSSPGHSWYQWPLIGWGIGLVFHGLGVFVVGEGSALKERMIRKEMEKYRDGPLN